MMRRDQTWTNTPEQRARLGYDTVNYTSWKQSIINNVSDNNTGSYARLRKLTIRLLLEKQSILGPCQELSQTFSTGTITKLG